MLLKGRSWRRGWAGICVRSRGRGRKDILRRRTNGVAEVLNNLILGRSERDGVNRGVGDSEFAHDFVELGAASVISRLANQQDGAAIMALPPLEHVHRVIDGINRSGVVLATRLEPR